VLETAEHVRLKHRYELSGRNAARTGYGRWSRARAMASP